MGSRTKKVFWGFFITEYKIMIEQLEEMATKGWLLEKINGLIASFKPILPQKIKYCVDIFPTSGILGPDNREEYDAFIKHHQEIGWDFAASKGELHFFYSSLEERIPVSSELEIQEKILNSKEIKNWFVGIVPAFQFIIFYLSGIINLEYTNFLTSTGVALIGIYPLLTLVMLLWSIYTMRWSRRLKICIANREIMQPSSVRLAKGRAGAYWIILGLGIFIIIAASISDSFTGDSFTIGIVLTTFLPVGIVLYLKKYFKRSNLQKRTKVAIMVVVISFTVMLVPFLSISMISRSVIHETESQENKEIPIDFLVMTLEDFQGNKNINIEKSRKDKKASPFVPKYFNYWEIDDQGRSIRTEYYEAIFPFFSKHIFNGILEEEIRHHGVISASSSIWHGDKAVYIGDTDKVLVRKENIVIFVEGDFDLDDPKNREIVISKLLESD